MPFVFKFSAFLLAAALFGGQMWQHDAAAPGSNAAAAELRASCPAMGGPEKIVTKGDKVRLYDAYAIRVLGDLTGAYEGCNAR